MQRQILMRSFVVALAALLTSALPASTAEPGEADTDSPLVDILMSDGMTREEMVGLYGALAGGGFEPPDCVPGEEMFDDVPASSIFCPWIEELARSGITGGCDADNYCPGDPVSRAQMAIFIVKTLEAARPMWAAVHADGEIEAQSGGISVLQHNEGNGFTQLKFPRPIENRAIVATIPTGPILGTPFGEPGIKASACGDVEGADCSGLDDTHVVVAPFIDGSQTEAGFYIAVLP